MTEKRLKLFLLLVIVQMNVGQAQRLLSYEDVLSIVRAYHPVAIQANLKVDSATAILLAARGSFDPLLYVRNEQKTFDGKNYYFYTNPELKIPTWFGVELKAGLEDNGGERLSPEVTAGRSSYAGISVPLAKNLLFDKRRAVLQQSKLLINQSEADRRNAYNNLLYEAAEAYWNWYRNYQVYQVLEEAISINKERVEFIRKSFYGGDRAAIDTTEALTQLQTFMLMQSDALLQFQNAGLELSNYLWTENEVPWLLPEDIIPDTSLQQLNIPEAPVPLLEQALTAANQQHPKLASLGYKTAALKVERRLKFQSLLPTVDVQYNFLSKGYQFWKGVGQNFFENNYKYGFNVGMPLFLRQARGEYRLSGIKLNLNTLEIDQTQLEIENKVKQYYNAVLQYRQQVAILEENLQMYQRLLSAEEIKFSIGESSVFLLNSRENKVLEVQQKLQDTKAKYFKSLTALQWASGTM